jgi:hypothetical protein
LLFFGYFRSEFAGGCGPVLFDYFQPGDVSDDSVSEPFGPGVYERFEGFLVGFVVYSELVRIEEDNVP